MAIENRLQVSDPQSPYANASLSLLRGAITRLFGFRMSSFSLLRISAADNGALVHGSSKATLSRLSSSNRQVP